MKTKRLINIFLIFILLIMIFNFNTNTVEATETNDLQLYSDAVILIENRTGKTLFEKNSEQKMYPASTTKILTAILVIEKGNLNDNITVSKTALAQMKSGYSSAYLVEGEVMSVQNLLEVLLVHSANDASNVLAEYISGSIDGFVNLMNEKLKELGCTNSHFVTTNGLHDDNHYTTAKDLCTITRYCMQNETFRRIVSMKQCTIPATNKSPKRIYKNTNDMLDPTSIYYYPNCIGIKTGYTSQAKNCLISACSKNNLQLIAVVLGSSQTEKNRSARYVDSKTLYDYGYSNYSIQQIAQSSTVMDTIEVKNGTKDTKKLDLILDTDISALVNNNSINTFEPQIILNDSISAPISKNTVIGKITYTIDNESYSANLLAAHDVEKRNDLIWFLGIGLVIIIILILILNIISKKSKKNSKR